MPSTVTPDHPAGGRRTVPAPPPLREQVLRPPLHDIANNPQYPPLRFQIGSDEGQVPVRKLQRKIMRLPGTLKPAAVTDLNNRLKALQPTLAMPKGPLPRNARQPQMPRPRTM